MLDIINMGTIASNSALLRELKDRIHRAFEKQPQGPAHMDACEQFHRNYDALAYPGGLKSGFEHLAKFEPEAVETAILFLEFDPMFFGSGYIKETLLRRLKQCELADRQLERLESLILRSMDCGGRREFKGFSRLVRITHSPALIAAVNARQSSLNPEVVRRAHAVLHVLKTNRLL